MKPNYNWKPKHKYGAQRVKIDGISFASKKEAKCYLLLKDRQRCGEISDLQLQVKYELNPGGTFSYSYFADFVYVEKGVKVVADAKGFSTTEFKKKMKLMKKVWGIDIKLM